MEDLISRQAAIDALNVYEDVVDTASQVFTIRGCKKAITNLPSVQPTCEGCKHLGKWENEVEYGYPSPCTCCKRRVVDHYER